MAGGKRRTFLFIDMHHLVSDGISTPILMRRLDAPIRGKPELPEISFRDYAYWLENRDQKRFPPRRTIGNGRWKEPVSFRPSADKQRPKTFDYRGENIFFSLDEKTAALCADFCQKTIIPTHAVYGGLCYFAF